MTKERRRDNTGGGTRSANRGKHTHTHNLCVSLIACLQKLQHPYPWSGSWGARMWHMSSTAQSMSVSPLFVWLERPDKLFIFSLACRKEAVCVTAHQNKKSHADLLRLLLCVHHLDGETRKELQVWVQLYPRRLCLCPCQVYLYLMIVAAHKLLWLRVAKESYKTNTIWLETFCAAHLVAHTRQGVNPLHAERALNAPEETADSRTPARLCSASRCWLCDKLCVSPISLCFQL